MRVSLGRESWLMLAVAALVCPTSNAWACSIEGGVHILPRFDAVPVIAYFIADITLADGTTLRRGRTPRWERPHEKFHWQEGNLKVAVVEPLPAEAECVALTAVLPAGERVDLGEECVPDFSGGMGCGTTSGASHPVSVLMGALLFWRRRRRRC